MTKINAFLFLVSCYIAFTVCSIIPALLPHFVISLFPIVVLGMCILIYPSRLLNNKSFIAASFYVFALYIAVSHHKLAGIGYGTGHFDTFLIDLGFTLPSIAIAAILIQEDTSVFRKLGMVFLASVAVSLLFILPVVFTDKSMVRRMAYYSENNISVDLAIYKIGFWGYTMLHVISLSFAILWGLAKYSVGNMKTSVAILAVFVFFIVVQMSITTTFIYILLVAAILAYQQWKTYKVIGYAIVGMLLFCLIINIHSVLDLLLHHYAGTDMESKIVDFIDIVNGGTGDHSTIDGRTNYQKQALNAFFSYPIVGNYYKGGGHSILLNRLGTTGIVGFIPFFLMIYYQFKQWYSLIPNISKPYFLLSWLGALILLYAKSCFGQEGFLFISIIIPALAMMYSEKSEFETTSELE